MEETFNYESLGIIHSPWLPDTGAPYQPVETKAASREFYIEVFPQYEPALEGLEAFKYIYLLYHLDRSGESFQLIVSPPWTDGFEVGLFASRSPERPNPIGLSIVRLIERQDNLLFTSGLDVFDGTPLLDIKPYIQELDSRQDANYGWLEQLPDKEHLLLHIKGIPH
jgi:tRNA-Thr(GGU) m(6)t(6)A37 methyltransferase TsaA